MRKVIYDTIRACVQHTRPHPGRGLLARLGWKLHPEEFEYELPVGVRICLRLCQHDDIAYWTGAYVTNGEAAFLPLLKEGMNVIDVGANIGTYALQVSLAIGATGTVYAFEPVPRSIRDRWNTSVLTVLRTWRLSLSRFPIETA